MPIDWRELKTIEDFREAKKLNEGLIVITDKDTGDKVHKPSCVWVKEENFAKKVISNKTSKGSYYWIANTEADRWKTTPCGKCM